MGHDVFISYAADNKLVADAILERLEQAEVKCWIAPRNIRPGDSWGGAIVRAIETSKILVLVFSSKSNESQQVLREVERAVQRDVVLLPFRIEDVVPSIDLEYFLSTTQWLDAMGTNLDEHLDSLVETSKHIIAQRESNNPASLPIQSVLADDLQPELEPTLEVQPRSDKADNTKNLDLEQDHDSTSEISQDVHEQELTESKPDIQENLDIGAPNKSEGRDIFEKLTALNLASKDPNELDDVVARMKQGIEEPSDEDEDTSDLDFVEAAVDNPREAEESSSLINADATPESEPSSFDPLLEESLLDVELESDSDLNEPNSAPNDPVRKPNPNLDLIIERNNSRNSNAVPASNNGFKLPLLLLVGAILIGGGWYGFQNRDLLIGAHPSSTDSKISHSNKSDSSRPIEAANIDEKAHTPDTGVVEQAAAKNSAKQVESKPRPKLEKTSPPPKQTVAKDTVAANEHKQITETNQTKLSSPIATTSSAELRTQAEAKIEDVQPQALIEQPRAAKPYMDAQLKEEQQRNQINNIQAAAEQGNLDAILKLAKAYESGKGVKKDLDAAAKWTRAAAENGHAESQYKLSQLLSEKSASDQDGKTALYWAEQAANQSYPQAQNLLGLWYEKGIGVEQNYTNAYKWYNMAAEAGDMEGQKSLGIFHEFGLGIPQNHQEALRWYKLSADQGDSRANFFFKQLTERLKESGSSQ